MAGTIRWLDLAVSIGDRELLHPHSGVAHAGRLLGVLGPSGSGKTTLLGALSGVLPARASTSGVVRSEEGSSKVSVAEGTVALLEQDDSFFSELTVRETLCFAAELEGRPSRDAALCADSLLRKVGLAHIAGHRIGNRADSSYQHGGVTKGERRRLAVACAIVGEEMDWCEGGGTAPASRPRGPRALLADEPTTGLDAFQAARVVKLLHELAVTRQCAAIATLHQPRASIWGMLDDVMLVAPGGYAVYCGPREEVLSYFAGLDHACPREGVNPAEFLIDMISVDAEDAECAAKAHAHIASLAGAYQSSSSTNSLRPCLKMDGEHQHNGKQSGKRIGSWSAFRLLLRRSLIQMVRDRVTSGLRLLAITGLSAIFSLHFGKLDGGGLPTARSVASRICLVSFGVIAMAMLACARALDRFSKERGVVARERAARRYHGIVYLTAKVLCELPTDAACSALFAAVVREQCGLHADMSLVIGTFALVAVACASLGLAIGAASPRADAAIAVGAPVMAVHMLTGVIDPAGQAGRDPGTLILLLRSLSPIRHGIEALCVAELQGMTLARSATDAPRMGGLALVRTGDEVLRRLNVTSSLDGCMLWLAGLTCLHLAAATCALVAMRPQFSRSASRAVLGAFCPALVSDHHAVVPLRDSASEA